MLESKEIKRDLEIFKKVDGKASLLGLKLREISHEALTSLYPAIYSTVSDGQRIMKFNWIWIRRGDGSRERDSISSVD